MTWLVIASVGLGVAAGHWLIPDAWTGFLDNVTTVALCLILVGTGIDLGRQKEAWRRLGALGLRALLLPLLVAAGSLSGAVLGGMFLGLPLHEAGAIGAGFGWYSLSGVLLAKIYNVETGALAFLTNVFRELMAFALIPVLAARLGKLVAVAPGGATTMDTTLPLIARVTDADTTIIALVSGTILSALVPVLVPLIIKL
ncbi:lysine exporter LysO family protein [Desulfofundulus thermosubterraneus]|uniref:Lysine exporter LysO family protein n=1 Tax=Desulfofundulus thermosubterraneus DSM 16057 TaxID=1121432 RepID=A0A1M6DUB0_9FIRM|nr:lysine exporter LysO family protein [Desulfofundulus thermosubterraneus]SHI76719.1 Membrane protein of unknown function [Desulfofundulus thermosubterraneus DSM 16057]